MTNNTTEHSNVPHPQASLPLPPGNFGLPIIGETISFFTDPDFAAKQQAKYGSVFKTRLLGSPTVFMVQRLTSFYLPTRINILSLPGHLVPALY
jgi:retinoid hydroxylase